MCIIPTMRIINGSEKLVHNFLFFVHVYNAALKTEPITATQSTELKRNMMSMIGGNDSTCGSKTT
jgi:hypothetical protein